MERTALGSCVRRNDTALRKTGDAFASAFVDVRGMRHHVMTWGDPQAPTLFMLHGWMDVGASFQFLVDALDGMARDRARPARFRPLASGSRRATGSGTTWPTSTRCSSISRPTGPVRARRPQPRRQRRHALRGRATAARARVVSLDGFGIPAETPDVAPAKLAKWLDALRDPP